MKTLAAILGLFVSWVPALAWDAIQSPSTRVHLVELFTSEGCSSCPPAESWLTRLRAEGSLFRRFVPVSYHVDYWNAPWADPYSKPSYTQRQRDYSVAWGKQGSVYTPGFVVDGEEWRTWGDAGRLTSGGTEVGVLAVKRRPDGKLVITFTPTVEGSHWTASAAVLGNGIASHVGSGENGGQTLQHDFVALVTAQAALARSGKAWSGEMELSPPSGIAKDHLSLAVWVTRDGDQAPVQAVGSDW